MKKITSILFLFLLLLPLAAPLAPRPATAQGVPADTPTATVAPTPAGPTLLAVQPAAVSNVNPVALVVTGSGFLDGAAALLDSYGALETSFVSPSMLRALLPAGVPPGVYGVTVINPDAGSAALPNALTVTAPPGPTATPPPTSTPAATPFLRPQLVVAGYGASAAQIVPGENLDFEMTLANAGQASAANVVAAFPAGDFVARDTGGVRALGSIGPGGSIRFWQPLSAGSGLPRGGIATLQVEVTYTDVNGTPYSERFALTFPVRPAPPAGPGATATMTPTPTPTPTMTPTPTRAPLLRPALLIGGYGVDAAALEPGVSFTLTLTIDNRGEADARGITMIVGGGTVSGGVNPDGTPDAGGGLAGAGGSFAEFAPVASSNVQSLGDLARGGSMQAIQHLIVNATTQPGAYPLKISFVYTDAAGVRYVDDQVITLLVYRRPKVAFSFYMPAPFVTAGQPAPLPLQLVNVGATTAILGTFSVSSEQGSIENGSIFIGALEPGGSYPLDALLIPFEPGLVTLQLSVTYTDDFNQLQLLGETMTLEVFPAPDFVPEEPSDPGPAPEPEPEGFWQMILRIVRGLLGLSSAPAGDQPGSDMGPAVDPFGGEAGPMEGGVGP